MGEKKKLMAAIALCINLRKATERWRRVLADVVPRLPQEMSGRFWRIDAVDGKELDPCDPAVPLSPVCRLHLRDRWRICNGWEIDSLGAVGCTLSHVACWRRIVAAERECGAPCALVLEDDCCLSSAFLSAWEDARRMLDRYDLVVLGHRPADAAGFFFGSHCYAVTTRGAQELLRRAFPIQLHVDLFIGFLLQAGCVRGVIRRPSVAEQCMRGTIGHFDQVVGLKRALPDGSLAGMAALLLGIALFAGAAVAAMKRTKEG